MAFPTSIKALKSAITARQNAARRAEKNSVPHEKEIQKNETVAEKNLAIARILKELAESWRQPDPGKYQDAFFFLDVTRKRVVVQEFLARKTKRYRTREEWERFLGLRRCHTVPYDGVPYYYPVVGLSDVCKEPCAKCKSMRPVVERYVQTYDSPEGDDWLKEHLVVCLDCNLITTLESKTSDIRF